MRKIAFLRAINVGGHTVKMAVLKELFEELGCENVETFIASGNVLFDGQQTEKQIEAHLEKRLGYEVATFLRTPAEVERIAARRSPGKGEMLYVGFLKGKGSASDLEPFQSDEERLEVHGHELYWLSQTSLGRSKLSGAKLEKVLGPLTLRNWTTVNKLSSRARGAR